MPGAVTREAKLIRIGRQVELWKVLLWVCDLGRVGEANSFAGILGLSVFKDWTFTIDFPARRLELSSVPIEPIDGHEIVGLWLGRRIAEVTIDMAGTRVSALVDTGNPEGLFVPEWLAEHLAWRNPPVLLEPMRLMDGRRVLVRHGRLDANVQWGRHVFQNPIVTVSPEPANIGAAALADFVVSFDQKNERVRFRRRSQEPIRMPALRGVGMSGNPVADHWVITEVLPGSPAQENGITEGDEILLYTPHDEGGASLEVVVRQKGITRALRLPVVEIIP